MTKGEIKKIYKYFVEAGGSVEDTLGMIIWDLLPDRFNIKLFVVNYLNDEVKEAILEIFADMIHSTGRSVVESLLIGGFSDLKKELKKIDKEVGVRRKTKESFEKVMKTKKVSTLVKNINKMIKDKGNYNERNI